MFCSLWSSVCRQQRSDQLHCRRPWIWRALLARQWGHLPAIGRRSARAPQRLHRGRPACHPRSGPVSPIPPPSSPPPWSVGWYFRQQNCREKGEVVRQKEGFGSAGPDRQEVRSVFAAGRFWRTLGRRVASLGGLHGFSRSRFGDRKQSRHRPDPRMRRRSRRTGQVASRQGSWYW